MPELNRPIRPDLGPFTPEEVRVRHDEPNPLLLDADCEYCVIDDCRAAAVIDWSDLSERSSVVLAAGRLCIVDTITTALRTGVVDHVNVTVPLWNGPEAAALAEVSYEDLLDWDTAWSLLIRENGRVPGVGPRYAADQIDRAQWLGRLTRRGLALQPAAHLLHYRDLAQQITETLPEIGALSHA